MPYTYSSIREVTQQAPHTESICTIISGLLTCINVKNTRTCCISYLFVSVFFYQIPDMYYTICLDLHPCGKGANFALTWNTICIELFVVFSFPGRTTQIGSSISTHVLLWNCCCYNQPWRRRQLPHQSQQRGKRDRSLINHPSSCVPPTVVALLCLFTTVTKSLFSCTVRTGTKA